MSEPKTPPYNFKEDIKGWNEFLVECEQRIKDDEKELLKKFNREIKTIEFKFLRDPEICPKPKYLLLAMEPLPKKGEEEEEVNFFPLFLHYCAWKYLRDKNHEGDFDYYITDLAKGTMSSLKLNENYITDIAKKIKEKQEKKKPLEDIQKEIKEKIQKEIKDDRYLAWLPLFEKEWELLSKPKIIVISKELHDKLKSIFCLKFVSYICGYVKHYTRGGGAIHMDKEYKDIEKYAFPNLVSYKPNEEDLDKFKDKMKKHLDPKRYNTSNFFKNYGVDFALQKNNETAFAVYRHNFEQLLKNGNIIHSELEFALSQCEIEKL
jgi:hypothetical protein